MAEREQPGCGSGRALVAAGTIVWPNSRPPVALCAALRCGRQALGPVPAGVGLRGVVGDARGEPNHTAHRHSFLAAVILARGTGPGHTGGRNRAAHTHAFLAALFRLLGRGPRRMGCCNRAALRRASQSCFYLGLGQRAQARGGVAIGRHKHRYRHRLFRSAILQARGRGPPAGVWSGTESGQRRRSKWARGM